MSLLTSIKARLARQHGFTLIEMLVATATGMVVLLAAFALLDVSASQSSRIGDKVDADQQARTAMENIMLELHSSCVAAATTPVQAGSDDTSIGFISQMGSSSNFPSVDLHVIHLVGSNLIDDAYQSDVGSVAPAWSFPYPGTPTSSRTLIDHVAQSGGGTQPIFQYYRYYNSSDAGGVLGEIDPTPLPTPLSAGDAQLTAQVAIGFTAGPDSGNPEPTRSVNLSNTAVLRFSPSSADPTTTNTACS